MRQVARVAYRPLPARLLWHSTYRLNLIPRAAEDVVIVRDPRMRLMESLAVHVSTRSPWSSEYYGSSKKRRALISESTTLGGFVCR